ncbi:MAG: phage tail tape measure protein, partial [Betaproteobacteria bacterium]
MGTIWAEMGLNYAGLTRGMQEATRQIEAFDRDVNARFRAIGESFSARFRAIGESFSQVGRSLSLGITAPLATLGGFASKAAMGFESAMANVWTIADVTKAELAGISAQVEAMSMEVPQSAQQLAQGLYDAIGSGITDVADAMKVLEVAAKAGQAGASDTATAMDALTSTINAYGLAASYASRLADIMFRAVDRGKLTFAELAGNIGDVISTAATAKVPFEEIAAAFATLTKGGVNAAESATAVNQAILSII